MVLVHEGDGRMITVLSNQAKIPEDKIIHIASIPQVIEIPFTPPFVR